MAAPDEIDLPLWKHMYEVIERLAVATERVAEAIEYNGRPRVPKGSYVSEDGLWRIKNTSPPDMSEKD